MAEFGPDNRPRQHEEEVAAGFEVLLLPQVRFSLGQMVATPGALEALEEAHVSPAELLARHLTGDWGQLDPEDWAANDRALLEGARLLSAYTLPETNQKLWIITEWDRSYTTILRPDEY